MCFIKNLQKYKLGVKKSTADRPPTKLIIVSYVIGKKIVLVQLRNTTVSKIYFRIYFRRVVRLPSQEGSGWTETSALRPSQTRTQWQLLRSPNPRWPWCTGRQEHRERSAESQIKPPLDWFFDVVPAGRSNSFGLSRAQDIPHHHSVAKNNWLSRGPSVLTLLNLPTGLRLRIDG